MLTQTILEQLKARAYETPAAATGDALADLINWIALHAARLDGKDMSVMMSAALALYKIEIEKNWEVSALGLSVDPADPVEPAHLPPQSAESFLAEQESARDAAESARATTDARHAAAEAAIASLVALRRPAADGAQAATPMPTGRRWTDTGHWALTLR